MIDQAKAPRTLGINCSFSNMLFILCFNSTCCSYCDLGGSSDLPFLFLFTWNGRRRIAEANLTSACSPRLGRLTYIFASSAIPHLRAIVSIFGTSSTNSERQSVQ